MAKWASNLSVEKYDCPRCGAEPGVKCLEPSGRKKSRGLCAHGERMQRLTPADWDECKGTSISVTEWFAKVVQGATVDLKK